MDYYKQKKRTSLREQVDLAVKRHLIGSKSYSLDKDLETEDISVVNEMQTANTINDLELERLQLKELKLDEELVSILPETLARRYLAIVIGIKENKLQIAINNPFNHVALQDLRAVTQRDIIPIFASEDEIVGLIDEMYGILQTRIMVSQIEKQTRRSRDVNSEENLLPSEQVPTVQFINHMFDTCILKGASDIHIEPMQDKIRIRYRIDGQLYEFTSLSIEVLALITTRIKVLSGLNITEKRLPQDGRLSWRIKDREVSLRISFLPTIFGEKIVVRIIDIEEKAISLSKIGFYGKDYDKVLNLLRNPYGMIILTGPTGSGKSTTLSAAMMSLDSSHFNIVTVEDPVENIIPGITQVNINEKIGLTFASILRHLLRQDPDIIMVGEMRDQETSQIAVEAALTGHLVLSTLHTNDAVSAIYRLTDMGIENYMVGATVKGIISQRLVRCLCKGCREPHIVNILEEKQYKITEGTSVYKAKGCHLCNDTGYKGRMAVHEVLVIDSILADLIAGGENNKKVIKEKAMQQGMRTLQENVRGLVLEGTTTMEEMLKIAYEQ